MGQTYPSDIIRDQFQLICMDLSSEKSSGIKLYVGVDTLGLPYTIMLQLLMQLTGIEWFICLNIAVG